MEQLKLGTVPTQPNPEAAAQSYTSGAHQLPDLDAHSPEYAKADLHYDATKEDWSFKAQGLTPDNLPLLYPESTISEQDFNALFQDGGANPSPPSANPPVPGKDCRRQSPDFKDFAADCLCQINGMGLTARSTKANSNSLFYQTIHSRKEKDSVVQSPFLVRLFQYPSRTVKPLQ